MITGSEIELYLYKLLVASPLKTAISGDIYTSELRPPDSKKEDIVITFASGLDGQFSEGIAVINLYVPFQDPGAGRPPTKDSARCKKFERMLLDFRQSLPTTEILFQPANTITTFSVPDIRQNYINLRLKYRHYGT